MHVFRLQEELPLLCVMYKASMNRSLSISFLASNFIFWHYIVLLIAQTHQAVSSLFVPLLGREQMPFALPLPRYLTFILVIRLTPWSFQEAFNHLFQNTPSLLVRLRVPAAAVTTSSAKPLVTLLKWSICMPPCPTTHLSLLRK